MELLMDILTVSDLDCVDKAAIQVFGLLLDVLSVCSEAYTHTHTHISWVYVFNNGGNRVLFKVFVSLPATRRAVAAAPHTS